MIAFTMHAQNWNGTYQTNFGTVKLVTENGIVYGDYANNGTILAYEYASGGRTQLHGVFFNGNQKGKFIWTNTSQKQNSTEIIIEGLYTYDSNITLKKVKEEGRFFESQHFPNKTNEWKWTGSRTSTANPNDLQSAVWNGKWTTTFGNISLEQVGLKVNGLYSNLGNIEADYSKSSRMLKGTFTNKGKIGYFEFILEGNSFKGKWGWTTAMTEGNWNGNKLEKTNKVVAISNPTQSSTASNNTNTGKKSKYRFHLRDLSGGEFTSLRKPELYGFVGIQVYRVTSNGREKINSFGNKGDYFFNLTENQAFSDDSKFEIPETPEYYRDFEILDSDINNPNVDIEVVIFHHFKGKITGSNYDWEKISQTFTIERYLELSNVYIGKACVNGVAKENYLTPNSKSYVNIKIRKL